MLVHLSRPSIRRRLDIVAILLVSAATSACHQAQEMRVGEPIASVALESLVREARGAEAERSGASYRAPTAAQRALVRQFASATARGARGPTPPMFSSYACGSDRRVVALRGSEAGAGVYALRTGKALPLLVLVPHSFWDTGTLPIGRAVFQGLRARALLVNTVHRYKGAGCPQPGGDDDDANPPAGCPSDVAHASDSYFEAVHEGLALAFPGAVTLALHGFARSKDDPDLIVSAAGTRFDLAPLMQKLVALYGAPQVRSFPDQIDRLGGTTSIQAKHRRQDFGQMVHLEMSRELRDRLVADPGELGKFVHAVGLAFSAPGSAPDGQAQGSQATSLEMLDLCTNVDAAQKSP